MFFAGVTTEVCVQTSMREGSDRGFKSLVIADCTESYTPAFKAATLDMLTAQAGLSQPTLESRQGWQGL